MSEYSEEDYLQMSGIQHFCFCRRQWALIHIEEQWQDNILTAEGEIQHARCHDSSQKDKRKDVFTVRGLRVVSHRLKLSGCCDVVEFHSDTGGVSLDRLEGLWKPIPIEYKHGTYTSSGYADKLQVCAEAMALEEMLVCEIPYAYLFYQKDKRREKVDLNEDIRNKTLSMAREMWEYASRGYTPKVKIQPGCKSCSLNDICLPQLTKSEDVSEYIRMHAEE